MTKAQRKNLKVTILAILFLSVLAVILLLKHQSPNFISSRSLTQDQKNAFKRTDFFAKKLINDKFMKKTKETVRPSRGLASVVGSKKYLREVLSGEMGFDPWGVNFHYLVKKNPRSPKKGLLIIWSSGKNKELETTFEMVAENHNLFEGDDFGKAYPFEF